jgi:hypothetical protein
MSGDLIGHWRLGFDLTFNIGNWDLIVCLLHLLWY